jgi:hypothetical protein
MSSSCQTNLPSWCIPFCVRFINLHFERSGSSSHFFHKCVRCVLFAFKWRGRIIKLIREYNSCMKITSPIGLFCVKSLFVSLLLTLVRPTPGTVLLRTSCLTRQICILNHFTLSRSVEARTFVTRQKHIRGLDDLRDIFSLTSAFLANMNPPMDYHSTSQSREEIKPCPNTRMERHCVIRFPQMYTISEAWFEGTL